MLFFPMPSHILFLRLSCGFALLIIQPVNLLKSLVPTNLNFALQFKE